MRAIVGSMALLLALPPQNALAKNCPKPSAIDQIKCMYGMGGNCTPPPECEEESKPAPPFAKGGRWADRLTAKERQKWITAGFATTIVSAAVIGGCIGGPVGAVGGLVAGTGMALAAAYL